MPRYELQERFEVSVCIFAESLALAQLVRFTKLHIESAIEWIIVHRALSFSTDDMGGDSGGGDGLVP